MAGADDRGHDRFHLLAQAFFVGRLPFVGADVAAAHRIGGAVGEQLALFVDDRDALRAQAIDGGGDQVADGAHLGLVERAAHFKYNGGRRVDLVAREQRPLRHDQMHARGFDAVDALDGTREFAFERTQAIDVLHEARGAERVRLVEDLVADAAALRQAALGERHPQPRHPIDRHHDDIAVVAHLVGDALPVELLGDRPGIFERQASKERRHLRRCDPHDDEGEKADQGDGDGDHGGNARAAKRFGKLD